VGVGNGSKFSCKSCRRSNLATEKQDEVPQSADTRVLGTIILRHEVYKDNWARLRFQCQALCDELELSRYLCQELVKQEGVHTATG